MSQPPLTFETKSTVRFLTILIGGALLCAGGLTWMATSCVASPAPQTQTIGEPLLASLDTTNNGFFRLTIRNASSRAIQVEKPAYGASVKAGFVSSGGQPVKVELRSPAPSLRPAMTMLAPGEEYVLEISRDTLSENYEIPAPVWVTFTYEPGGESEAGKPLTSNAILWVG